MKGIPDTLMPPDFAINYRTSKRKRTIVLTCFLTIAGVNALPASAQVLQVRGTQCDIDIAGNIYLLDGDRNTLLLYDRNGTPQQAVGGSGWLDGQFDRPSAVWARNGIDVFVADYGNHRIQRFDRTLSFVSTLSTRESSNPDERFGYPTDVALSRMGELYICDSENGRVVKVDRFNKVERSFGGFGAGKGRLNAPTKIEVGPKDAVYVLDGPRIAVFDAFGNYLRDVMPGMLHGPTALYGDPDRLIVAESDTVWCFDAEERPAGTIPLNARAPAALGVRTIAAQGTTLWVLSAGGLFAFPDMLPTGQSRKP